MAEPREPTALLLRRLGAGEESARSEAAARFGHELQNLAQAHFRRARQHGMLQPTVLVNELWLRLAEREGLDFANRWMFLGFASHFMRGLLVDEARSTLARGRGATDSRVDLTEALAPECTEPVDLLDLDAALRALEALDPASAQLVELRFFGGLELSEIAASLGVSESTVDRRWRFARAWLRTKLAP